MNKKILLLLLGLVLISGCGLIEDYKLNNYQCKQGERIGDSCWSNITTETKYVCREMLYYETIGMETFIYGRKGIYEEDAFQEYNGGWCVCSMIDIIDVVSFEHNYSNLLPGVFEPNSIFNRDEEREICVNVTYFYRRERPIYGNKYHLETCGKQKLIDCGAEVL